MQASTTKYIECAHVTSQILKSKTKTPLKV